MQESSGQADKTGANGSPASHARQDAPRSASPAPQVASGGAPTAAQDETLVRIDAAGVRRGGRWLVRGVTFDIRPGEIGRASCRERVLTDV